MQSRASSVLELRETGPHQGMVLCSEGREYGTHRWWQGRQAVEEA